MAGPGWTLTALATPGHTGDSLSFAWAEGGALFPGDLVMGWATTLISPPDGDLAAFRASLARLQGLGAAIYYPGHGAPVGDPQRVMAHILAHRAGREAEILARLGARAGERRRAGGGDLCRRRSGAARRGGAQRAGAPDRPRGARAGRGGRAAGGGALPAGVSHGLHSQRSTVSGSGRGSRPPPRAVGQDYRVGRFRDWRNGRGHELRRRLGGGGSACATTSARSPACPAASLSATNRASCGAATLVPLNATRAPEREPAARMPGWAFEPSDGSSTSGLQQRRGLGRGDVRSARRVPGEAEVALVKPARGDHARTGGDGVEEARARHRGRTPSWAGSSSSVTTSPRRSKSAARRSGRIRDRRSRTGVPPADIRRASRRAAPRRGRRRPGRRSCGTSGATPPPAPAAVGPAARARSA